MAKPSCYNRPDFKDTVTFQDGWEEKTIHLSGSSEGVRLRLPRMVTLPFTMSKDCKQWGPFGEAKLKQWDCLGCKWRKEDERIQGEVVAGGGKGNAGEG